MSTPGDQPGAPAGFQLRIGEQLHRSVVLDGMAEAERHVWITTADLKDMHIELARGYRPLLETFADLAQRGVRFRIIHAKLPSQPFRDTLDKYPELFAEALELQECPRMHAKLVLVDGRLAYLGSANFTGAGLGGRRANRRNHELGVVTRDPAQVKALGEWFDGLWIGAECDGCAFRDRCPDPIG